MLDGAHIVKGAGEREVFGGYAEICGLEERVGCVEGWEGSLCWDCSLQTLIGFFGLRLAS